MISAILFDFGGTLDADGAHWLDRFYRIYAAIGLESLTKDTIKDAFYWAESQTQNDSAIRGSDYRQMVERHVRWQFQKLGLKDTQKEAEAVSAFVRPAERILHRNRHVLESLSYAGFRLGVVSNNYGNLETLCREFGYDKLMETTIDSVIVGLKKPDPRIFQEALKALSVAAEQTTFVGDSLERDMQPAKDLGMMTLWLTGDVVLSGPTPRQVDGILRSLEELPDYMKPMAPASLAGSNEKDVRRARA